MKKYKRRSYTTAVFYARMCSKVLRGRRGLKMITQAPLCSVLVIHEQKIVHGGASQNSDFVAHGDKHVFATSFASRKNGNNKDLLAILLNEIKIE